MQEVKRQGISAQTNLMAHTFVAIFLEPLVSRAYPEAYQSKSDDESRHLSSQMEVKAQGISAQINPIAHITIWHYIFNLC